jgi:hypothetical protein
MRFNFPHFWPAFIWVSEAADVREDVVEITVPATKRIETIIFEVFTSAILANFFEDLEH